MGRGISARAKTWPTASEVAELAEKLRVAYNAVAEFSIRTHDLIDREDPYELPEGVPVPSLEQSGSSPRS